jgi:hypothetical protein
MNRIQLLPNWGCMMGPSFAGNTRLTCRNCCSLLLPAALFVVSLGGCKVCVRSGEI